MFLACSKLYLYVIKYWWKLNFTFTFMRITYPFSLLRKVKIKKHFRLKNWFANFFFKSLEGHIHRDAHSIFFSFEIWPNPLILCWKILKLFLGVSQNFCYFWGSGKFPAIFWDPLNEEHKALKNIKS